MAKKKATEPVELTVEDRKILKRIDEKPEKVLLSSPVEDTSPYGQEITLSERQEKDVRKDIDRHIDMVRQQRSELMIEEEWEEADQLYAGTYDNIDDPYPDATNMFIHITAMFCDILLEKEKKRTFVRPFMMLKGDYSYDRTKLETVGKIEKWMDCRVHADNDIEESLSPIYSDANRYGTGIAKLRHCKIEEPVRELEIYESTQAEIDRFQSDFTGQEDTELFKSTLAELMYNVEEGLTDGVECWVEKNELIRNAPDISRVDPKNLLIDCYGKSDLRYDRCVPECMPDTAWAQLVEMADNKYLDKEVLERLKKNDKKYAEQKYTVWEVIYIYPVKKKDTKCLFRYVEEDSNRIGQAITFPYITRAPNYVLYTPMPRNDRRYGDGIPKRLKETNLALNKLWSQEIDSGTFRNKPAFFAQKNSFNPAEKDFGPDTIYWTEGDPRTKVMPVPYGGDRNEIIGIITRMERYAEWIIGISAYMSGRESPLDPNAPAAKAYMLLQESNLRLNAYIRQIDKGNKKVWGQLYKMYYQFFPKDGQYYEMNPGDEQAPAISKKDLALKVEFIPSVSDITINKALEKEENMTTGTTLLNHPMFAGNPAAVRKIFEIILKSSGGNWEKYIDILLPSEKEANIVSKIIELMKLAPPQQILAMMQGLAGNGQGMGGMPQNAPPKPDIGSADMLRKPGEIMGGKVPPEVVV